MDNITAQFTPVSLRFFVFLFLVPGKSYACVVVASAPQIQERQPCAPGIGKRHNLFLGRASSRFFFSLSKKTKHLSPFQFKRLKRRSILMAG